MKTIELTQGMVAVVDDCDYEPLSGFHWYALREPSGLCYAGTHLPCTPHNEIARMHRMIMGFSPSDSRQVDHINGDTLDNRRENLRECTTSQNAGNRRKHVSASSRFRGVSWHKRNKKWCARLQPAEIREGQKSRYVHLGYFVTEEDAARAYNAAAVNRWGKFAYQNQIA